uniref:Zinc finger protein 337-like n=1 Tax=Diabrotica virgifera virgifera TaxID=50390 RepID=A0A6P7GIW2_DIAVI
MGLWSFKCTSCGKAFFTNTDLLKHIRMTHEKLRPHVCKYCGSGFSSKYALKTHTRQHTDEKQFVCQHCFEGLRQRVSLPSHLKSRHGIEEAKEFFCKTREKGFATDYALSIHQRLHETKKCEICSENFAEDEYLTNHLREVLEVEVEMTQDN